jgi:peptidoglycan/xylan/chitin deacetylase (PgdA/CDA1 family)
MALAGMLLTSGCAATQTAAKRADAATCSKEHGAIIRGPRTHKRLALVFTGGDYGEGTAHILDVLEQRRIKAAFFLTGGYLATPGHPALVRRMVAEGHYVGPHSHGHLLYCPWEDREQSLVTRDEFAADLGRNIAELRALGALGDRGPVLFIPPYEWFNAVHVGWADELGVTLINFTPGSGSNRDYVPEGERGFAPSARLVADILAYEARDPDGLNGFLLLLHVGSLRADKMHTQLGPLIDALERRGYAFVRVDALLR